jgi:hypothetical protein
MAYPEREFRPGSIEADVMAIVRKFTGTPYPLNSFGLTLAHIDMQNQHARVRLRTPISEVRGLVIRKDPIIRSTAEDTMQFGVARQYAQALQSANFLHEYGAVDHQDSLGGEALNLSLNAHRLLMGMLLTDFRETDSFLSTKWDRLSPEIDRSVEAGDRAREEYLLRMAIHSVVLNGTLGEDAKEYWDPYALITVD